MEESKMIALNDSVGASSGNPVDWHCINWVKCHQEVRRLQVRIVKATQEGRHGKVKALQWLLTHSFNGKALAVKRVTENQGRKTSGVDGKTWSTPRDKSLAVMTLGRHGYKTMPLKRIYIPKSNGKKRPLGIPTMKDRAMQALYLLALEPVAETIADKRSFGFRPKRSTADAIEQCFTALSKKDRAEWILEGDIKGCFDNISHDWLLDNVQTDKTILKKWLKAGFVENRQLFPTESGTPQGGIISPALANLTLDGLEQRLRTRWKDKKVQGKVFRSKVNYVRYADDCVPRRHALVWNIQCMRCCTKDEGRPLETAIQVEVSNHRKLRRLKAGVVSVTEKARQDSVRYVSRRRTQVNHY
jgi:RNA-directed DNA polymerase